MRVRVRVRVRAHLHVCVRVRGCVALKTLDPKPNLGFRVWDLGFRISALRQISLDLNDNNWV